MSAFVEQPAEPARNRYDVVAAVLLGLAATLTAVASFLAGGQDGLALERFSTSNAALSDANFYFAKHNTTFDSDVKGYQDLQVAELRGDDVLAEFLRADMSQQLSDAVDWAEEQGGDATPFDEGSPYEDGSEDLPLADDEQEAAERGFEAAAEADAKGDQFGISTVLFALTLFFGGISTLQERPRVTQALLGGAGLSLLAGLVQFVVALLA